jgi:hypothetical protein
VRTELRTRSAPRRIRDQRIEALAGDRHLARDAHRIAEKVTRPRADALGDALREGDRARIGFDADHLGVLTPRVKSREPRAAEQIENPRRPGRAAERRRCLLVEPLRRRGIDLLKARRVERHVEATDPLDHLARAGEHVPSANPPALLDDAHDTRHARLVLDEGPRRMGRDGPRARRSVQHEHRLPRRPGAPHRHVARPRRVAGRLRVEPGQPALGQRRDLVGREQAALDGDVLVSAPSRAESDERPLRTRRHSEAHPIPIAERVR